MTEGAGPPAFLEIVLRLERRHVPVAEAFLLAQGAQAVSLTDHGDTPLWEPGVGETPLWEEVRLTGLFAPDHGPGPGVHSDHDPSPDPSPDSRQGPGQTSGFDRERLLAALSLLPLAAPPEAIEVEDQPWERAWMDRFVPMRFGRRLWIVPSDSEPPDPSGVLLFLDPGVAFGTGTHATTRLCLEWLDAAELTGREVLDFGCGSGVLGIAAALLGAASVHCIDHDPQAVWATRRNAEHNGVADRVQATEGDRPAGVSADVVIANILAGILVNLAPGLVDAVRPGGWLVLTGVLAEQADPVIDAFTAAGCPVAVAATDGDWVRLDGRRP